mgnify:CR=1 FL=1
MFHSLHLTTAQWHQHIQSKSFCYNIFSDGKEINHLNIAEQYYSKSEEKTKNVDNKIQEEGATEKYHVHVSELNDEQNIGMDDTFYFNTETEKPQYFEEDTWEVNGGSENYGSSEKSKHNMINFDKINRLGDKRRSKSSNRILKDESKSYISDDCQVDISPKNWAIDKMPKNLKEPQGVMAKLSECTNTISQFKNKIK